MKEYFSKKYQKAKLHFKNFRAKTVVRFWGLAKRLDRGGRRNKKK